MRGYQTELDLNHEQRTACLKHAGCARLADNWGLARAQAVYRATGQRRTAITLHRELNALKKTDFPWMYAGSTCAPQAASRDVDSAPKHCVRRVQLKKEGQLGFPQFKQQRKGIGSLRRTGSIHVFADSIPRLGRLRLHAHGSLPVSAKVLSATVSKAAGRWFVSVQVEAEAPAHTATSAIGVDLGMKTLADGTPCENRRAVKQAQKQLRRFERQKSRRSKGGTKTGRQRAQQHARIAHIRKDATHKLLVTNHALIAMADLNVSGMRKNHQLAQAVAEIRRQLPSQAERCGTCLVVIDRFSPASKTCSACGYVKPALGLHERIVVCEACGMVLDRDHNAAINLLHEALRTPDSSSGSHACGGGSSGRLNGVGETSHREAGTKRY